MLITCRRGASSHRTIWDRKCLGNGWRADEGEEEDGEDEEVAADCVRLWIPIKVTWMFSSSITESKGLYFGEVISSSETKMAIFPERSWKASGVGAIKQAALMAWMSGFVGLHPSRFPSILRYLWGCRFSAKIRKM